LTFDSQIILSWDFAVLQIRRSTSEWNLERAKSRYSAVKEMIVEEAEDLSYQVQIFWFARLSTFRLRCASRSSCTHVMMMEAAVKCDLGMVEVKMHGD
jgi:hypothetical protein